MRSLFKLPLWPSLCKGGCNYILRQLRRCATVERRYGTSKNGFGGHDFTEFGSEYEGSIYPGLNSVCMCLRCQCAPRGAPHCQFCGATVTRCSGQGRSAWRPHDDAVQGWSVLNI